MRLCVLNFHFLLFVCFFSKSSADSCQLLGKRKWTWRSVLLAILIGCYNVRLHIFIYFLWAIFWLLLLWKTLWMNVAKTYRWHKKYYQSARRFQKDVFKKNHQNNVNFSFCGLQTSLNRLVLVTNGCMADVSEFRYGSAPVQMEMNEWMLCSWVVWKKIPNLFFSFLSFLNLSGSFSVDE